MNLYRVTARYLYGEDAAALGGVLTTSTSVVEAYDEIRAAQVALSLIGPFVLDDVRIERLCRMADIQRSTAETRTEEVTL